jgi:uncharacterized protein YpuA (DUF1002 family)
MLFAVVFSATFIVSLGSWYVGFRMGCSHNQNWKRVAETWKQAANDWKHVAQSRDCSDIPRQIMSNRHGLRDAIKQVAH